MICSPLNSCYLSTNGKHLMSSPSTILRCLNRVALSFLTSWIFSVDFLTSTWSFLLNMIHCEPPAAARTGTTIDGAQDGPHRYQPAVFARSPFQRHQVHGSVLSGIGVKFRTHLRSDVRDGHLDSLTGCSLALRRATRPLGAMTSSSSCSLWVLTECMFDSSTRDSHQVSFNWDARSMGDCERWIITGKPCRATFSFRAENTSENNSRLQIEILNMAPFVPDLGGS